MARAPLRFWKYEGTANDFLVVQGDSSTLDLDPAVVAALCDRHRGVGGDGVLLITPPGDEARRAHDARARMVVRNADGSRPEMCGNGLRCVALHVAARDGLRSVVVETDAGPRACEITLASGDEAASARDDAPFGGWVRIDMGLVRVLGDVRVEHRGRAIELIAADAGNPHAIALADLSEAELDPLGAELQRSAPFPKGVNLERVTLDRDAAGLLARVQVFERGVGRTLACGTGACAVAAVLVSRGTAPRGEEVRVELPGGILAIAIDEAGHALMRGPARRVFAGSTATDAPLVREAAPGAGAR
jgi:diaminopimelate epimerase